MGFFSELLGTDGVVSGIKEGIDKSILTDEERLDYFHTVYLTTNMINNKIYVGVHSTDNPNDSYIGSGVALKNAIEKHGRENFSKQLIAIVGDKELAYFIEEEIVDEEFVNNRETYNCKVGGIGGDTNSGRVLSDETKRKIGDANRGRIVGNNKPKGWTHSDESRVKISKAGLGAVRSEEFKENLRNLVNKEEKIECEHCNRMFLNRHYVQYHGDKCKEALDELAS